jgi:EAL domain-containing protein (putative c-di-GMP-specific phosphodiesterase class I)
VGVLDFIISKLKQYSVDGNRFCFEITETAAISHLLLAENFIIELKKFGCRFALDDFGSGLSSFGYLKNLPVDYLKIDGVFVKDMMEDKIDYAMVKAINQIGHIMGMQTIAEFVEHDKTKHMLKEMGVDYAQGYAIHKPQPFHEILKLTLNNVSDS